MPLIGFTIFKNEIKAGSKRQTIRHERKHPIKVGDLLYLYWHLRQKECRHLRTVTCIETFSLFWQEIQNNEEIAKRDGFQNAAEMRAWFTNKYGPIDPKTPLYIIRW